MLNPTKFEDLFASDDATYEIPPYQRAYAWTKKQLNQLLTDLREQPQGKDYYLGHFLLECPDPKKKSYYVIDGQQRLTTVALFFSCLIAELEKRIASGAELIDVDGGPVELWRWQERYLVRRNVRRFRTVAEDDEYFHRAFVKRLPDAEPNPARQSQQRLQDAQRLLQLALAEEADPATLLRWAHLLATASVSAFEETDKVRATQIFAFQNDRGIKLTTLEKLKAYLMHRAYLDDATTTGAVRTIEHVERVFADIYARTEEIRLGEDTVLRYHNVAFGPSWEDAFENVKRGLRQAGADEKADWITEYCDSLCRSFYIVREIEHLAAGNSNVTGLLFLRAEDNWPLILKIERYHSRDRSQCEALYRLMEIISFKFEFSTGAYRSHDFHWVAKNYTGNAPKLRETLLEQAHNGFRDWWAFTQWFNDHLQGNNHYHRVTRYLLWQYENHLRRQSPNGKPVAGADFLNIWEQNNWEQTLDHITPQHPSGVTYSKEFRETRLHNLGNLALLMQGPNSRKSNTLPHEFPEIFSKSPYLADQEIAGILQAEGQWDEPQILARKQRIVDFAKTYWAVPAN